MKFNLNVKRENPVDKKMTKTAQVSDIYVISRGANKRVFAVAISPTGGRKYFVEVSTLQIVHELSTSATRQDIKNEAAIRFGAGDYIAVEDIKDTEVAMNVTLR